MKRVALLCSLLLTISITAYAAIEEGLYDNETRIPSLELIESAKKNIDIAVYEMKDPDVIEAISKAVDRGVKVRVIKEPSPVGGGCKLFNREDDSCVQEKKLLQKVKKAGGKYIPFAKSQLCPTSGPCFMHGKLIIVDRSTALISTGNFNSTSLCNLKYNPSRCDRDLSYVSKEADVISGLESIFENDLTEEDYDLTQFLNDAKYTVSPYSLDPLVAMIDSAKKSIRIENQYLKEVNLNEALMNAAERGVKVEVMTASICSFGKPSASEIKKFETAYEEFEEAGIRSYIFTRHIKVKGKPGYLHAKAIVVDDNRGWVGSVNGSNAAFNNNREFGIFFQDTKQVKKLAALFDKDKNDPGAQSWKESVECK